MTRKEVLSAIEEAEREGAFDRHVDPIPEEIVIPVTESYHYPNNRTLLERIKFRLQKIFVVWPFIYYQNRFVMKTRVIGRENLKGLHGAVLTCNHVAKFDCLCVKYAARGHRTFTVAAPFNNMRGFLGEMMRAGDMLPMSKTLRGNYKFNRAVEYALKEKDDFLLVYPEASMWWHYKKPRPYKSGAFHIAEKYHKPVVPMFITYRDSGKTDQEGIPEYYFTLHIMPPIFSDPKKGRTENIEAMQTYAHESCKAVYEKAYGVPLDI